MKSNSFIMQKIAAITGFTVGAVALVTFAGTWTAPTASYTQPSSNIDAPINVTSLPQSKTGQLKVDDLKVQRTFTLSPSSPVPVNGQVLVSSTVGGQKGVGVWKTLATKTATTTPVDPCLSFVAGTHHVSGVGSISIDSCATWVTVEAWGGGGGGAYHKNGVSPNAQRAGAAGRYGWVKFALTRLATTTFYFDTGYDPMYNGWSGLGFGGSQSDVCAKIDGTSPYSQPQYNTLVGAGGYYTSVTASTVGSSTSIRNMGVLDKNDSLFLTYDSHDPYNRFWHYEVAGGAGGYYSSTECAAGGSNTAGYDGGDAVAQGLYSWSTNPGGAGGTPSLSGSNGQGWGGGGAYGSASYPHGGGGSPGGVIVTW